MRDEIYRFGIVFYNNKGIPSPVYWIGDIRMPSTKDAASINSVLYPFHTGVYSNAYGKNVEQMAYAMGVEFNIKNIPFEATSWEIVRCDRTESDRTVISQGILGSLIQFDSWEGDGSAGEYAFGSNDIRPLPIFNLSSLPFPVKFHHKDSQFDKLSKVNGYYEFVSPEVCVSKDSVLPSIANSKIDRLYDVATFNDYVKKDVLGKNTRWLGYK